MNGRMNPRNYMSQPTCANCPHWLHIDGGEGYEDEGECHESPPRILTNEQGGVVVPYQSVWTPTQSGEWCGKHPAFAAWLAHKALLAH